MRRFLLRCLALVCSCILLLTALLSIPSVETKVRHSIADLLSKSTGLEVTIDSFSGVAPFFFTLNNVEFFRPTSQGKNKVAAISTLRFVPAWFDCLFGRLSFYHVQFVSFTLYPEALVYAESLANKQTDATNTDNPESSSQSFAKSYSWYMPRHHLSVYSLTCNKVFFPKQIHELLLLSGSSEDSSCSMQGSLFWNPKRKHFTSKMEITELQNLASKLTCKLDITSHEAKAKFNLNCPDVKLCKPLSSLPCNELSWICELKSKNQNILKKIWGKSSTRTDEPYMQGTFKAYASPNEILAKHLPNLRGISTDGKILLSHDKVFSVETGLVHLHKEIEAAPFNDIDDPNELTEEMLRKTIFVENLKTSFSGKLFFKNDTLCMEATTKDFQLGNFNMPECTAKIEAITQDDTTAYTLQADATVNSVKLACRANGTTDLKTAFSLSDVEITTNSNKLQGNLQFLFNPFLVTGRLTGKSNDLAPIGLLLRKNIDGKGVVSFDFNTVNHGTKENQELKQKITFSGDVQAFRGSGLTFKKMQIQGSSFGFFPKLISTVNIDCQQGQFRHLEIQKFSLTSEFDLFDELALLPFKIKTAGKSDKGTFAIEMEGGFKYAKDTYTLKIPALKLNLDKWHAELKTALEASIGEKSFVMKPMEIMWDTGASLSCEAKIDPKNFSGKYSLQQVPLDILSLFYPSNVITGSLSGKGEFFGNSDNPKASMHVETNSLFLGSSNHDFAIPLEGFLQVDYAENRAFCTGELTGTKGTAPLHAEISLPLLFDKKKFSFLFRHDESIVGKIVGKTEIAPFFIQYLKDDEVIEGIGSFDIGISGTLAKPYLKGGFSWHRGKLDLLKTGMTFSDIELEGIAEDTTLIATKLTATDEKKGELAGDAKLILSLQEHFPFEFNLNFKQMEIIKYDYAEVLATGKAKFFGNSKQAELTGTLVTDKAELNFESDISSELPSLQFIYINNPLDNEEEENHFNLKFDIAAHIPNNGRIIGRGLQSKWKGDLKISGDAYEPLVFGDISATRGKFSFSNKDFNLIRGDISFNGDVFTNSRLNFTAEKDLGQLNAQILLRGSLKSPRLSFQSTPPLQEKEILAWVLFNKPLAEISAVEGLQLAQVYISLNGRSAKFNIMEKFKKTFGIDHIDISKSERQNPELDSPEVNVQIGKYLSKDVLLRLSKDVANEVNRVAIEANLHKNVSVQAEVGDDQQGQMTIKWKHDY
jgi:hypothetical protein